MAFTLAACAEMLWRDRPIDWRCARLDEMGFEVGLWNWADHDIAALAKSRATFSIMNGYLDGRLADDDGADTLLASAREAASLAWGASRAQRRHPHSKTYVFESFAFRSSTGSSG